MIIIYLVGAVQNLWPRFLDGSNFCLFIIIIENSLMKKSINKIFLYINNLEVIDGYTNGSDGKEKNKRQEI